MGTFNIYIYNMNRGWDDFVQCGEFRHNCQIHNFITSVSALKGAKRFALG